MILGKPQPKRASEGARFLFGVFLGAAYTAKEQESLNDRLKRDKNFAALLAPEQQEAFLQYTNEMGDLYAEDTKHFYIEGVKIGIMIGIEAAGALGGK